VSEYNVHYLGQRNESRLLSFLSFFLVLVSQLLSGSSAV
jgi:hypothetical protein